MTEIHEEDFPLPSIDPLVNLVANYEMICFMDRLSGSNYIFITKEDWRKIAFHYKWGIYFYMIIAPWSSKCGCHLL